MKKTFLCLLLLFSLFVPLVAQETEVNEQYEFFSWEPVAKAKQYGVTIEKFDNAQDIWTDYKEIKTKETEIEVLFTPGVYRVSISSYNLIGRKSKGSDWVQFMILEENIPYLNEKAFAKSTVWKVPVLFLSKTEVDESVKASNPDFQNYIKPAENYGSNSILVKGRNIFSPKTEFYLIPKDEGEGEAFVNLDDERKEQKLKILYRNSKEYSVVVSYDESKLAPGYYSLEVRNPGNNSDALDILVLENSLVQISPDKGFEIDEHYSVNCINVLNNATYQCSVLASGVNSSTEIYLEPAKGIYAYPFEANLERARVYAQIVGSEKKEDSKSLVTLEFSTEALRTGYYNIVAKNWDGSYSKFLCLVKRPFNNDYTKQVKTLKTKYNKRTEYVDVTLQDEVFSSSKKYTLVSEYDESIDSNKKVELTLDSNGKKLTGTLTPDQLTIARYALLIEDYLGTDVIYCEIDNTLKLSMTKMSPSTVEQVFFRPVNTDTQITMDSSEVGTIEFFDNKVKLTKRLPSFFNNMRLDLSMPKDANIVFDLEFDIFNNGYFGFTTGTEYRMKAENEKDLLSSYALFRFGIPNNYFAPYLAVGLGQIYTLTNQGVNSFSDFVGTFSSKDTVYGIAQLGVSLFVVLDVKYNLFLNDMFSKTPYFTDSVSVGFSFPLRSFKFKRKVLTRQAKISKEGAVDIKTYVNPDSNIDFVTVVDSESVTGLENYKKVEIIEIGQSVQIIEENAFRNCENLKRVGFDRGFDQISDPPLTIKNGAFAEDTQVGELYLPYRTSVVQTGAFAGWTNGQNIILCWNEDDTTERDLSGLLNCAATIHYRDGALFKGAYETSLDDEENWVPLNNLDIENVSVYHDDRYDLGIRITGFAYRWFKSELDTWINQETPDEALAYLKSGNKLTFKVNGDGRKYTLVLTTQGGGYFYYTFKTQKNKVTKIEIPYKKMKKYSYSSLKKLDIDNLKMFCIMPECDGAWNDVTFFDFEVVQ
ncbi:MAG: CIA30 family protein [Treponema sp.]|nr:CIA30 family protein [Treponema sp.]